MSAPRYSGALAKLRNHSGALTAPAKKQNDAAELPSFPALVARPLKQSPLHRPSFNAPAGPAPDGSTLPDSLGGLSAMIRSGGANFPGCAIPLPGGNSAVVSGSRLPI